MRAILLAAGKGTRMYRHFKCPKSALKVDGKPIIRHSVEILREKGIDVTIVLGYDCETVRECLDGIDVDYCYNPFYSVTNSLGSLWFAREYLVPGDQVIIANADVYWEPLLLERLLEAPGKMVMVGDSSRYEVGDYFFYVEDGMLAKFGKDLDISERNYEYVGLAKIAGDRVGAFSERLESMVKEEKYDLWWENVLYNYLSEEPVSVVDVPDLFWAEVDYVQDYERIKEYIRT